ncbi:MAG: DUF2024 family protein [Flavobacteriaceae bacterium]|nr:DUF2024 family protein [Flavobacteriaceae bacterium]
MKIAVWDTYVPRKNGKIMHFDIMAPAELKDEKIIYQYGKEYLKSKDEDQQPLTSKECRLCHIETATPEMEKSIQEKGYFIYEMENCD